MQKVQLRRELIVGLAVAVGLTLFPSARLIVGLAVAVGLTLFPSALFWLIATPSMARWSSPPEKLWPAGT